MPLLLACLWSGSCSSKPDVVTSETVNLSKVREAYLAAAKRLGRPPRNLDELKPSLQQIGDPQELLRSRTGEPLEIVWNRNPRGVSKKDNYPNILAYERFAVAGMHYIVTSMGVAPLSDEELTRRLAEQKP
jgi:hypothetical protein